MSRNTLSVTGTGDSLFLARFPEEYTQGGLRGIASFIQGCDFRLTNLETNLSDFEYFPNAYSGGTWLNTRRELLTELFRYGFNYFGTANNHCMDYGFDGLLSTLDTLDRHGAAHSGTGRSLEEAARPAILEARGRKAAVFAVDASLEPPLPAGRATHDLIARPGVNFLRHDTTYTISEEELGHLKAIAAKTGVNHKRDFSVATGFLTPAPDGIYYFGQQKYTTRPGVPQTACNAQDKARLTDAIREARSQYELVFVLVHCHDDDNVRVENPPAYLIEFAHACIDAGASAIFGGGCHRLRGIELYHGCPVFYSLGDFIYQGLKIEFLPADFMEKYGIDIYSTAEQALYARSRGNTVGLHCNRKNYQTVLPRLEFEDGRMTSMSLLPVALNFERKDDLNGLPVVADDAEAKAIHDLLNELSAPFGLRLERAADGLLTPAS